MGLRFRVENSGPKPAVLGFVSRSSKQQALRLRVQGVFRLKKNGRFQYRGHIRRIGREATSNCNPGLGMSALAHHGFTFVVSIFFSIIPIY